MLVTERLLATIKAAVPAVVDVSVGTVGNSATVFVSPADQQAAAQATINAFPWTQAAQDAWEAAAAKVSAKAYVDTDIAPIGRVVRGIVTLTADEINLIRDWITAFKAATAGAGTLAAFKTAVAALDNMPTRTNTQVKNAVKDAIDAE